MTYLDNAATTFPKPPSVIKEISRCLKSYCGNPGRGSHRMSLMAAEKIYTVREKVADLLYVNHPEGVVFTHNATYALNLAIKSFVTKNCHVLTSDFEHNSVIRPLERLKRDIGLEYSVFSTDGDTKANLRELIKDNTVGIISSIGSNVTGDEIDLGILSKVAKEYNLFLIIDASQIIGHKRIDLSKTPCDVLCAPGHKALFGIQGSGFAYFSDPKRKEGIVEGGSGFDSESTDMPKLLPEGYEAGTLSTPAIASLGSGIEFIEKIGISEIEKRLYSLTYKLEDRLSSLPAVTIYKAGCGILSFNYADFPSSELASFLDDHGICVRGGLHCAPSIHRKLGTITCGCVRVSLSYFNKIDDLDKLYKALLDLTKK